jgi:hypothetical protein
MTSRFITRKPKGATSRNKISSLLELPNNGLSLDSSRTGSRNLARNKSRVLRSFVNTKGIKKTDVSADTEKYLPFEPSIDEKLISPAHF